MYPTPSDGTSPAASAALSGLAFVVFAAAPAAATGERLSITLTLLLTAAAYKANPAKDDFMSEVIDLLNEKDFGKSKEEKEAEAEAAKKADEKTEEGEKEEPAKSE